MIFDRRKLLKWLPAGVAAAVAPGYVKARETADDAGATESSTPDETYDVAIVGGGVAGCYVAYRLLHGDIDPDSPLGQLKASNGGKLNVGLFEYSGRVGGRLLSAELPQEDDPDKAIGQGNKVPLRRYSEFGGFRFQEQMHIVRDLATLLKLDNEPFPVDEPPENFVLLRDKRYKNCQLAPVGDDPPPFPELPYNLPSWELAIIQGQYADSGNPDITTYVANQAFAHVLPNDTSTMVSDADAQAAGFPNGLPNGYYTLRTQYHDAFQAEDWETVKKIREEYETAKQVAIVDGRSLIAWSWWALLSNFVSDEAIAYVEDSGGYNVLYSTGNVSTNLREDFYFATQADTYPGIYGSEAKTSPTQEEACHKTAWRHVTTGYSDIPDRLYKGFLKAGGTSRLSHQLLGFDKVDGGYDLHFFQRQSSTFSSGQGDRQTERDEAGGLTVRTQYLILAMPQHSLRLLGQDNFFLSNPTVDHLLNDTVINVPAMRIFMAYESPWWTHSPPLPPETEVSKECNVAPTCGRSRTNLRVRQFYYWHTAPDGGESFVLASYTNGQAEAYWKSLQNGEGQDDLPGSVHRPDRADGAQGHGPRSGSRTMARLAHEDLMAITGVKDAPDPYYCHFQNWTKDPWGAGWHAWSAGNDDDTLIPQILQPLPQEQVYICGESYSNVQGWVQGALNTSEVMLQKKLGLAYPSWLSPGGTWLGPGSEGIPTT